MNQRDIVSTASAPTPIGPYNQAIVAQGPLVFTAGQIPVDPATGDLIAGDIAAQTRRVLTNLQAVLGAAGSGLDRAVKVTVYLRDMNDFAAMNAVYAEFFDEDHAPARSAIQAARLPKDVAVEIDVIAAAG